MKWINHVIQRARERYGLILTEGDVLAILDLILLRQPAAVYIKPDHEDGGERWRVDYQGKRLRVAYYPTTETIATLLPDSDTIGGKFRLWQATGRQRPEED